MASSASGFIAAAQTAARRRIVRAFREAGALTADGAKTYTPTRLIERRIFARFVARGVIVKTPAETYYLDETALAADSSRRRKRIGLAMVAGAVATAIAVALA